MSTSQSLCNFFCTYKHYMQFI